MVDLVSTYQVHITSNSWGWTMEYVNGVSARITTERNDLKQQTAPHNHVVDVVDTQYVPAIYNDHLILLTLDLNFTLTSFADQSGVTEMGLDQIGLDQMGLDKVGIHLWEWPGDEARLHVIT